MENPDNAARRLVLEPLQRVWIQLQNLDDQLRHLQETIQAYLPSLPEEAPSPEPPDLVTHYHSVLGCWLRDHLSPLVGEMGAFLRDPLSPVETGEVSELKLAPLRVPWGDEIAERAILGAILFDPSLLPRIAERLQPDDFHLDRHRALYQAMLDLQAEETPIDLRSLQLRLEQRAQLDLVGGLAYIASLDLDLPDIGRIDDYVERVKQRSPRRGGVRKR